MVTAIRQTLTVQADGRLEVRSPQLRSGTTAEVIVLVEQTPVTGPPGPAERLAALDDLQRAMSLDPTQARAWAERVAGERAAYPRTAGSPGVPPQPRRE